jgi:GntR family transcriptional regulator
VADVLRRQVLQGAFADGLLPGEASLAQGFGASRNAIRDALGILAAEGLVVRVQGVGTMVATRKYPYGLDRLLGLAETLREHGEVVNEVRAAGMIVPPPAVAEAYMHVDEYWYCGPCAARCPTGAVTVNMPYLLR